MRFLDEAEGEFLATLSYYAEVDGEFAEDLMRCLDQAVAAALEFPHLGRLEEDVSAPLQLRHYRL